MSGEQHIDISGNVEKSIFTSGDHNLTVLGNIIVYPSSHERAPEQPAAVPEIGPNPYKGLAAFQERDHERFFGRDALIKELHAEFVALHATVPGKSNPTRLLAVLGPSGSGKSSVVRAGLLPELARQPLPGLREARVAVLAPGNHPLEALANSLARMAFDDAVPVAKADEFMSLMRKANHKGEWDGLRRIASAMPWIDGAALILLIDQFEEIYTLCEDNEERRHVIDNLLYAAADNAAHVSVIITLRSDFLGHTQRHPEFNHWIAVNGTIVHVMTEAELREAIARPAELADHPLDDATIDLLIQQSKEREGALPLLQFALTQIWDGMANGQPPAETLRKIGGVGGALANKAEELYTQLDEHGRAIVRRAFLSMIRLGEGTQDTRRRASLAEIVAHGEEQAEVHVVLQHFSKVDARLITLSTDDKTHETISEITHEALFDHWTTLEQWLDNGRDDVRFHRRLAEAASHWETNERAEGLLWRSPDLELLQDYYRRAGSEMTTLQQAFFQEGVKRQHAEEAAKEAQRRRELETQRKIAEEARARQAAEAQARKEAERRATEQTRSTRRMRWLLRGVVVALLAAVGIALFAWYQQLVSQEMTHKAEEASHIADQRRLDAEKAKQEAEQQTRIATARQLATQSQAVREKYPQRSLLLAIEAMKTTSELRIAEAEQALRDALSSTGGYGLGGHDAIWGDAVAKSQDKRWLVTSNVDGKVRLWDLQAANIHASARILWNVDPTTVGLADLILVIALSPDGRWLFTGSGDYMVRRWDLQAEDVAESATVLGGHEGAFSVMTVSPDGCWLVTGTQAGTVQLWDLRTEDVAASATVLHGHEGGIRAVEVSSDGRWLITGGNDSTIRLWDLRAEDMTISVTELRGHKSGINAMAVGPDGRWLMTGDQDGAVRLWDLWDPNMNVSSTVLHNSESGIGIVIPLSVEGLWLTGDLNGTAWLLALQPDNKYDTVVTELHGHEGYITDAAESPDGHWLVTGSEDGTVRLWDLWDPNMAISPTVLRGHESMIISVAISPEGNHLVTSSGDGIRLWNLQASDVATSVTILDNGNERGITDVVVSPDGHWLVTKSFDNTARLWDLRTISHLSGGDAAASSIVLHEPIVKISPDGHWLVTGSEDGMVKLRDLRSPDTSLSTTVLHGHEKQITDVTVSYDGHWLVTGSEDGTARLWDLQANDITASSMVLRGHKAEILTVVVSPDNRWLVTGSRDGTARLWDLQADDISATVTVLRGREDGIGVIENGIGVMENGIDTITVSSGGRWLVTADSGDGTAWLWDLQASDIAASGTILRGHEGSIVDVAISPNERWLLIIGFSEQSFFHEGSREWVIERYSRMQLWDLQAGSLIAYEKAISPGVGWDIAVTMSADGHWLVTSSYDTVWLWNLQANDVIASARILHNYGDHIQAVALSPDNRWLVTGSEDGTARVWDLQVNDIAASSTVLHGYEGGITDIAVSPDNRWLVTSSWNGMARLWDLQPEDLIARACRTAGRNLSYTEWEQYFLDQSYRCSCPEFPGHNSVVSDIISRGRDAAKQLQIKEAVALFQQARALDPENPTVDFNPQIKARRIAATSLVERGNNLAQQINIDEAVALFEHALELNDELDFTPLSKAQSIATKALLSQGESLARQINIDEAVALFEQALELDAELDFNPLSKAQSIAAEALLSQGESLARQIYIDEAVALFEQALELDAELDFNPLFKARRIAAGALFLEGEFLVGQGKIDKAVALFKQALEPDAESDFDPLFKTLSRTAAELLLFHGEHLARQGEIDDAIVLFTQALEFNSDLNFDPVEKARNLAVPGLVQRGETLARRGKIDDAVSLFTQALEFDSDLNIIPLKEALKLRAPSLLEQGNVLAQRGKFNDAISLFKQAFECDPDLDFDPQLKAQQIAGPKVLLEQGESLAREGKIDEAISLFEQALKLDPDLDFDPTVKAAGELVERGWSLTFEGRIQEALSKYIEAQHLYERVEIPAWHWNQLCWYGSLWGYATEVLDACEKAVASAPEEGRIRDNRGLARALTGDIEGAIEDFQAFVEWVGDYSEYEADKVQRQGWIKALQAGENPFTDEVLKQLRMGN